MTCRHGHFFIENMGLEFPRHARATARKMDVCPTDSDIHFALDERMEALDQPGDYSTSYFYEGHVGIEKDHSLIFPHRLAGGKIIQTGIRSYLRIIID
jgi:hypothetical protein